MPLWAVWIDGALLFSTGAGSREGRNLGHDPRWSVGPATAFGLVELDDRFSTSSTRWRPGTT